MNWLEYFEVDSQDEAVQEIRDAFIAKGYELRRNGRFAVLNVGDAKAAVTTANLNVTLSILHWPVDEPLDPSHSGIFGYGAEDLAVTVELKALVSADDVHPAVE